MNQKSKIFLLMLSISFLSNLMAADVQPLDKSKLEAQMIEYTNAIQEANSKLDQLKDQENETLLAQAKLIVEQEKSKKINRIAEEAHQRKLARQREIHKRGEALQKEEDAKNEKIYLDNLHANRGGIPRDSSKPTANQRTMLQKSWESIKGIFGFGNKVAAKESLATEQKNKVAFSKLDTREKQEIFNNAIDSMQKDLQHDIEESRTPEASLAAKAAKADFTKNVFIFIRKINESGILRPDEIAFIAIGATQESMKIMVYNMSRLDPFAKNLNSMIDRYNLEFGESQEQRNTVKEIMANYYLEGFKYNEQSGESLEQQIKKHVEEKVEQSVDSVRFDEDKQINPDLLKMMVEKIGLKSESSSEVSMPRFIDLIGYSPTTIFGSQPSVQMSPNVLFDDQQDLATNNVVTTNIREDIPTSVSAASVAEVASTSSINSVGRRKRREGTNSTLTPAPKSSSTLEVKLPARRQRRH